LITVRLGRKDGQLLPSKACASYESPEGNFVL
jgi:hypothetical protein